jgi:branched-chain amino acid transport system ATP-binding protein
VFENILGVAQFGNSKKGAFSKAEKVMELVGLKNERGILASELSHGDQRLLEIALALAASPKLMLLDEPTSGLSTEETTQMVEVIEKVGKSIILVEHDLEVVTSLSDSITVLHRGKILFEGTPKEVKEDKEVQSKYLRSE